MYRRLIRASNMKMLQWSPELAWNAQVHADRCLFQHSNDRRSSGENIWAAPFVDLKAAVMLWFTEIFDRKCGCTNYFKPCCGHYTQVVWADTELVGCGMSRCSHILNAPGHRFILVCHYWPSGNWVQLVERRLVALPAFRYSINGPCSECAANFTCANGLCRKMDPSITEQPV
uniref:SCP domain-containing protein n=1 Tax=Trichuris muris TaxID=70415 RepID=A0A5S6QQU5_TRIMR